MGGFFLKKIRIMEIISYYTTQYFVAELTYIWKQQKVEFCNIKIIRSHIIN